MFWRPRRPSLLLILLSLFGLRCLLRGRRASGQGESGDDGRRARARRKFKEALDILFEENESAGAAPAAGDDAAK